MKVFGMVHKLNAQTQLLGFMSFKYALKSLPDSETTKVKYCC